MLRPHFGAGHQIIFESEIDLLISAPPFQISKCAREYFSILLAMQRAHSHNIGSPLHSVESC